ncbi:MAG: ribonuclease R [Rhodothermales bacterium]|nr:ribonuclease R [Rhodothermales bacterium]
MVSSKHDSIRKQVLGLLRNHGKRSFRFKEIAKTLGFKDNKTYKLFSEVMEDLVEEALIARVKGGKYRHRKPGGTAVGRLTVNPKGFGFVAVEDTLHDYFVSPSNLKTALDGDTVRISTAAGSRDGQRREAEVMEIVERGRTYAVGTFRRRGKFAIVHPDDLRLIRDIYVDKKDFGGAVDGQKVQVSIDQFDDPHGSPEGRVLSVIGNADEPEVQVLSLAMSLGVKAEFDEDVERELRDIPDTIDPDEANRRLDLRDKRTFTIDPEDAKDFDDAIHIEAMGPDAWEVGVHIADVSHFVQVDSATDREALSRGTSVYLVDRVIPMLPERLSNGLCSLQSNVDRLAFSCIMKMNGRGDVLSYDLQPSVIHSQRRLTYAQAQAIIDAGSSEDQLERDLLAANTIARVLTKRRLAEGSIDFDMPEVKVRLDERGHPVEMFVKTRMEANRLVEEFMLLANRTVAGHVQRVLDNRPFVYRVHDRPDLERIKSLALYVRAFGHRLRIKDGSIDSGDLNDLLHQVAGKPEEPVIEQAALRAMAKAVYTTENIGHYGLGFEDYTHFTSPIRRYPDLMVHRLLRQYSSGTSSVDEAWLEEVCKSCSESERRAEKAERESIKLKQVQYARDHLGDSFDGVVTGVTKFGVFVEISDLLVEGMVHVRDMDDDYYEYDEASFSLRGVESARVYQPGTAVRIVIVAANVETREIDLFFSDE